jgi:hypothetical protein
MEDQYSSNNPEEKEEPFEDDFYGDEDSPEQIAADDAADEAAEAHLGDYSDFEESLGGAR